MEGALSFLEDLTKISMEISRATDILQNQIKEETRECDESLEVDTVRLIQRLQSLPSRIAKLNDISEDVCKRRNELISKVAVLLKENVNQVHNLQQMACVGNDDERSDEINDCRSLLDGCINL